MTRREALALVAVVALVLAGRVVRRELLLGPDGAWRDPQWLADRLPDPPAPPPAAPAAADTLAGPLDPNTCPRDSLLLLPGIGPALADRIVAARERGVRFATPEDLRAVKGIGPRTVAKLAPWLRFPARAAAPAARARPVP